MMSAVICETKSQQTESHESVPESLAPGPVALGMPMMGPLAPETIVREPTNTWIPYNGSSDKFSKCFVSLLYTDFANVGLQLHPENQLALSGKLKMLRECEDNLNMLCTAVHSTAPEFGEYKRPDPSVSKNYSAHVFTHYFNQFNKILHPQLRSNYLITLKRMQGCEIYLCKGHDGLSKIVHYAKQCKISPENINKNRLQIINVFKYKTWNEIKQIIDEQAAILTLLTLQVPRIIVS
jgi:hypothetical protein